MRLDLFKDHNCLASCSPLNKLGVHGIPFCNNRACTECVVHKDNVTEIWFEQLIAIKVIEP